MNLTWTKHGPHMNKTWPSHEQRLYNALPHSRLNKIKFYNPLFYSHIVFSLIQKLLMVLFVYLSG